jgi:CheY-like chemotaxis protein
MTVVAAPLIAVIDDDGAAAFALSLLFEDWGYRAIAGANAEGIVRRLARPEGDELCLIVADFHLTCGDGIAAIQAINRHCGRICPAIVITGSKGGHPARLAARHGFPVLHKPFEPEQLRRLIVEIL